MHPIPWCISRHQVATDLRKPLKDSAPVHNWGSNYFDGHIYKAEASLVPGSDQYAAVVRCCACTAVDAPPRMHRRDDALVHRPTLAAGGKKKKKGGGGGGGTPR